MAHPRHKVLRRAVGSILVGLITSGCSYVIYDGSKSDTRHLIEQEHKGMVKNATAGPKSRS